MEKLKIALEKSICLQSHYATLLNQYDGGERLVFKTVDEWIKRLEEIGELPSNKSVEADRAAECDCPVFGFTVTHKQGCRHYK